MRALDTFHGGVHPPQHKDESSTRPIAVAPVPSRLVVPLQQHIGMIAKPLVKAGDRVLKGQMIGQAEGFISVSIHAPTSGHVTAVDMQSIPHPSGLPGMCVSIHPDGRDEWIEHAPIDFRNMDPSALRNYLRDAGVVGLGGAVFPCFIKLNPGPKQKIDMLILNGAECEPWITCDDMLMRERAAEIVRGIEIMRHILQPAEILIGIEDNKPEAIAAMRAACALTDFAIDVVAVPTIYPGGGAKQLTQVLTGKEVPSGGLPTDIGVQSFNVATAYTLHRAVNFGEPVISRIVTITGNVAQPQNFEALIGTPIEELVHLAGGAKGDTNGYILGGPMMGFKLPSPSAPLVKAANCVIASSPELFKPAPRAVPCIRCGRCAEACPVELQPMDLYWFSQAKNFGKAQEYNLFDCIECGCCDYVCPSHIPLVQYFRFSKSEIWAHEKEKRAADLARERHEFLLFRQEREKKEKAEKLAQKTAAAKATPTTEGGTEADAKKAAILAAVERAKAKKADAAPKNMENLPPQAQQQIEEIEVRRAKMKEQLHAQNQQEP